MSKQEKNQLRQDLLSRFTKNNMLLYSLSLPMQQHYSKFCSFLDQELKRYEMTDYQSQQVQDIVSFLRKFDLRRLATDQKFYPRIIECVINSLTNNIPVRFVQFACTKRIKTTD
jgi:hypothetical protein